MSDPGQGHVDVSEEAERVSAVPYLTRRGISLDELDEELKFPTLGIKCRDSESLSTNYSTGVQDETHSGTHSAKNKHCDSDDDLIPLQPAGALDTTMDRESSRRPLLSRSFGNEAASQRSSFDDSDPCSISVAESSLVSIPFSAPNAPRNVIDHSPTPKMPLVQPFFRRTNPITTNNRATTAASPVMAERPSHFPNMNKQQREGLFHSLSWDSRLASTAVNASPFRPRKPLHCSFVRTLENSQRQLHRSPMIHRNTSQYLSPQHRRDNSNNSAFLEWNATLQNKINKKSVFLLQSPQRMDFGTPKTCHAVNDIREVSLCKEGESISDIAENYERALQLLYSLVHRTEIFLHEQDKENRNDFSNLNGSETPDTQKITESFRRASQVFTDVEDTAIDHEARCRALDEWIHSHKYAMAMVRATDSTSQWLSSIGLNVDTISPSSTSTTSPSPTMDYGIQDISDTLGSDATKSRPNCKTTAPSVVRSRDRSPHSPLSVSLKVDDQMTVLARLNSAKKQIQIKDALVNKLNKELTKCREEIGRLRAARAEEMPYKSPNRSILDDDDSDNETSVSLNTAGLFLHSLTEVNESVNDEDTVVNETKAQYETPWYQVMTPPRNSEEKAEPGTPSCQTEMINVHMLDAENFETDWEDYMALPPPPNHDLRAPIVHSLLEQWTSDRVMHESLIHWVDGILDYSAELQHVPPLNISSLNHQVRDGFVMHVIPLLLRRADIQVEVKTRAHRRTTYDILVSVSKSSQCSSISASTHNPSENGNSAWVDSKKPDSVSMMAFNASSTKFPQDNDDDRLTSIISNKTSESAVARQYNSVCDNNEFIGNRGVWNDDGSVGSSVTGATCLRTPPRETEERSVLMKAIGGAFFGGLLSRRNVESGTNPSISSRNNNSQSTNCWKPAFNNDEDGYHQFSSTTVPKRSVRQYGEDPRQPFHRVVSAPPGKIGIELVQYRSNAMVSFVSPESPLIGYIFPSDILIAIDEVPVSGLRVRDIVKILTERAENRQRSLRIISSHAMAELTQGCGQLDIR